MSRAAPHPKMPTDSLKNRSDQAGQDFWDAHDQSVRHWRESRPSWYRQDDADGDPTRAREDDRRSPEQDSERAFRDPCE